jgi:putative hemolysin
MISLFAKTPGTSDYWMLAGIGVLLVVLVFLALAEMSMSQMTKPRAAALAEKGVKSGKALVRLADQPTMWVNPLLLTVNVCQTVQATLMGIVSGRLFGPAGVAIGVAINVVLFFVLAEAVPKTYALLHPVKGATITARPIELLVRFWPLRIASNALIKLTNIIVKGEGLKQGPFIGEQEFLGIVEAAAQDSVIEHEERELIESVIEFGDTVVREIMVPRPDVVFIDDTLTVSQALDRAVEEGFSRLPIFRKDEDEVDDVEGIVYVKDLVIAERSGRGTESVRVLMREVEVVPESKLVADLMRNMQAKKFHMVMVADEYGIIAGLATLEDCLEELVGEIVDEHDDEEEFMQHLPNGDYLVIGSTPISKINDDLEMKIPETEYDTIGGFIFGMLGHVPVVGEHVDHAGWRFSAEVLDGRRIQQVRLSMITP